MAAENFDLSQRLNSTTNELEDMREAIADLEVRRKEAAAQMEAEVRNLLRQLENCRTQ